MKRVIWAVNPYQNELEELVHDARVLREWFGRREQVRIEPVFVLTSGVRLLPLGSFRELLPELKTEARAKLDRLRALVSQGPVVDPTLLAHPSDHVESVADVLLEHAKSQRAELIVLRTQAKRGLARVFLGSLAETLLKRGDLPTLVLTPKGHAHKLLPRRRVA